MTKRKTADVTKDKTIKIPGGLWERIKLIAEKQKRSTQAQVEVILEAEADKFEGKK